MWKELIGYALEIIGQSPYKANLGKGVAINPRTTMAFWQKNIQIGDNACITGAYLGAGEYGKIIIEKEAMMGAYVSIIAEHRNFLNDD